MNSPMLSLNLKEEKENKYLHREIDTSEYPFARLIYCITK